MSAQPILVLTNRKAPNRFANYITEILATEGFACFDPIDLSRKRLEFRMLANRDLVIVANIPLSESDQLALARYVAEGGNLIALRPPTAMGTLFGVSLTRSIVKTFREGFTTFIKDHPLTRGLGAESLQYHGAADLFELRGARAVAFLGGRLGLCTSYPALALHRHGRGLAAAFAFDLAECTVLFHQGLRANASTDANGDGAYKPDDLFFRYLDERLKTIPQADVYADVLVRLVNHMMATRRPLPRLWHFPNAVPALAFMDGDSDSQTTAHLEKVISILESVRGKFTIYLMPEHYATMTPRRWRQLRKCGHDFGPHPFVGRMPTLSATARNLRREVTALARRYGEAPVAHRGHNVIWCGWTEHARALRRNGIRLDTNFCCGPGYQHGYVNGSGQPVRFMDEHGAIVDLYEQATVGMEDGWFTEKAMLSAMSVKECIALSKRQIDEAVDKYHAVYHPCFHPYYVFAKPKNSTPWLKAVAVHLKRRGVPFVNGREWVAFNDARRTVEISDLIWDAASGGLRFTVTSAHKLVGLTVLLPSRFGGKHAIPGSNGRLVTLEGRQQVAVELNLKAGQTRTVRVVYRNAPRHRRTKR